MSAIAMETQIMSDSQAVSLETSRPFFSIRDMHAYYGESYIVQGVTLDVQHGEILALLGRNGAGKTSTLRTIARIDNPVLRGPASSWCPRIAASLPGSLSRKTLPSPRSRPAMAGASSRFTKASRAWLNAANRKA